MYLVTGGAGFIGSAFLAELNAQGIDDILVVDRLGSSDKWRNLRNKKIDDFLTVDRFVELLSRNALPKKITAVVHLGACSSTVEQNADYMVQNNYRFSRELAEWALSQKLRFIYASTAATYGDGSQGFSDAEESIPSLLPLNIYAYSKQLFDFWALNTKALQSMVGLKFFNVYGPNEYHKGPMRSVIHKAFEQIISHGRVELFKSAHPDFNDGEQSRDFIYVKDCTKILSWFLEHPETNGIFNLGTGKARSYNDLANAVFNALDKPSSIHYIEMPEEIRDKYQNYTQAEMEKLQSVIPSLSFQSLEDGVGDYVKSYLIKDDPYL